MKSRVKMSPIHPDAPPLGLKMLVLKSSSPALKGHCAYGSEESAWRESFSFFTLQVHCGPWRAHATLPSKWDIISYFSVIFAVPLNSNHCSCYPLFLFNTFVSILILFKYNLAILNESYLINTSSIRLHIPQHVFICHSRILSICFCIHGLFNIENPL